MSDLEEIDSPKLVEGWMSDYMDSLFPIPMAYIRAQWNNQLVVLADAFPPVMSNMVYLNGKPPTANACHFADVREIATFC